MHVAPRRRQRRSAPRPRASELGHMCPTSHSFTPYSLISVAPLRKRSPWPRCDLHDGQGNFRRKVRTVVSPCPWQDPLGSSEPSRPCRESSCVVDLDLEACVPRHRLHPGCVHPHLRPSSLWPCLSMWPSLLQPQGACGMAPRTTADPERRRCRCRCPEVPHRLWSRASRFGLVTAPPLSSTL